MRKRISLSGFAFASPWLLSLCVFTLYPIGASIYYSLTDYDIMSPPWFVGFQNFLNLWQDDVFWISLKNTAYFFALGLPLQLLFALGLALLLNQRVPGMRLFRAIFFIPCVMPTVVLAMVWRWIFNADVGMINSILDLVGIHGPAWLADPVLSKPSLIIMSLWVVGGSMLIFLAALMDVPIQLYEAARLEGASALRQTVRITLPMISPIILFNLVIGIIQTFMYFTEPYIMTNGGPLRSTTLYAQYLYENAFRFFRMGYASALAWILFLIVLVLSLLALRSSPYWTYYESN